ncbi:MAG: tyrosine-type recombinase/integrase [Planctomycetes bacterium]|nr:tyrosine-type recombinase/integrase [Planctomycetota bacterium]
MQCCGGNGFSFFECTKHTLKRDAEQMRSEREAALNRGELPAAPPPKITLAQAIRMDAELHPDRYRQTVKQTDRALGRLANVLGGAEYQLSKIGRHHIARLRKSMDAEKLAPNTQALALRLLRGFFNRCRDDKLITGFENPLAGQKLRMVKTKRTRIYLPREIGAMLLASPDPWWRLFVLVAAETGLRLNELLHLRWADVRLDAQPGEITVQPGEPGTFEVGGRTYPLLPFSAKTDSSYRAVPLPAHLVDELRRFKIRSDGSAYPFIDLRRLAVIGKRIRAGTYVPNARPFTYLHAGFRALQERAKRILADQMGVPTVDWLTGVPHDFRASLVDRLKSAGVSLDVCARCLGHEVGGVLGKSYTTLTQADKLRVAHVLEQAAATGGYGPSTVHFGAGGAETLAR